MILKRSFLLLAFSISLSILMAQRTKPAAQKPPAANEKLILKTSLGSLSDSTVVLVEELLQLIALPLKITDDKKNAYAIVSYHLLYTKQGVTEKDENIEQNIVKAFPASTKIAGKFTNTPFPDIWIANVNQQLKPEEELFFYDVLVRDTKGTFHFAPNLKIKTK